MAWNHLISSRIFIDRCKSKFGWHDLSDEVVMDVGCGEDGNCARALLEKVSRVRALILVDKQETVIGRIKSSPLRIHDPSVVDIENRDTIARYEGRMSIVLSTHVFHQVLDKEKAFTNVYHLLKPGGKAAILFVTKSLIHDWVTEMLKIPKWKKLYKNDYTRNMYIVGLGEDHYKEMVKRIGFEIVDCYEEKRVVPSETDEICRDALYRMCGAAFAIPDDLIPEFKNLSLIILLKLSERDEKGRACYRATELSLLLTKPT